MYGIGLFFFVHIRVLSNLGTVLSYCGFETGDWLTDGEYVKSHA